MIKCVGKCSILSFEKTSRNRTLSNISGCNPQNISRGISAQNRSSPFLVQAPAATKAS